MADYANLKTAIAAAIKTNGNEEITGQILQNILTAMVNNLGSGWLYLGIATVGTNPGTPDQRVFYLASAAGTYSNFGGIVVNQGEIVALKYLSSGWVKETIATMSVDDSVYKIFGTRTELAILKYAGGNRAISSITFNGTTAQIVFNGNLALYGRNATSGNAFIQISTGNTVYSLANVQALEVDTTTGALTTRTVSANTSLVSTKAGKAVLLVNLWGTLFSPIPSLQAEIFNYYNNLNVLSPENKLDIDSFSFAEFFGENPGFTNTLLGTKFLNNASAVLSKQSSGALGTYYTEKLDCSAAGDVYSITYQTIEPCKKVRFYFKYKSNSSAKASIYFQNSAGGWVNNAGKVTIDIPANTSGEYNFVTIERDYEPTVAKAFLFIGTGSSGYSALPVGTVLEMGWVSCVRVGVLGSNDEPQVITINVKTDGTGDFTSVRNAVTSINDASALKRYIIYVHNGTYQEIDIKTRDYVDIVGESRDGVILYCDGNSTQNSPSDYSYHPDEYSNVPINTIPKAWKHLFVHCSNSSIRNLTMKITNCKYVIHQDNFSNLYNAIVEDCVLIRDEDYTASYNTQKQYQNLVGIGAKGGQFQNYLNCQFLLKTKNLPESTTERYCAMFFHNWNNQTSKCGVIMKDCNIFGCHIAEISELGSEQDDVVNIINVKTDNKKFGVFYSLTMGFYVKNGVVVTDPSLVPYCLRLNAVGEINYVLIDENRNGNIEKVLNADSISLVMMGSNVLAGQPVKTNKYGYNSHEIATDLPFGFAINAISSGNFGYVNSGQIGYGLALAAGYTIGDLIYINNGYFTKTQNGNPVGYAAETKTLSATGLLRISKI